MERDDLRTAFGPVSDRAEAMAGPLDRISLRNHVVEAEIGAFQVERGVRQRLRLDIVVEVRPLGDAADDVDRVLSYDRLAEAVAGELAAERLNLLETLAERVAARILREPQAERVFLRIEKLDRGPGDLGVEVVRVRRGGDGKSDEGELKKDEITKTMRPRVVMLGESEAKSPYLDKTLCLLQEDGAPLLLVAPATDAPKAATPEAQNRMDLLAADQGAWLLAGRYPQLAVAATRTEIDWNLRQGRPVIWAPAKLALDEWSLRGGPLERTLFFAKSIDAIEVVILGPPPRGLMEAPVRVRYSSLESPLEWDPPLE